MSDSEEEGPSKSKIIAKQKRELKDFQAKCKRELGKIKNKAEKKEREEAFKAEESEMLARHQAELEAAGAAPVEKAEETADEEVVETKKKEGPTKAMRRREKQAEKDAEKARLRAEEFADVPDFAAIEAERMGKVLKNAGLKIHEIPSDGSCLFKAIEFGLKGIRPTGVPSPDELRAMAADHMLAKEDLYRNFMDGEDASQAGFEKYCERIRDNEWGGDLELNVLGGLMQVKIQVYQAEMPHVLEMGDTKSDDSIAVSFHKHVGSHPHYNALSP